MIASDGNNCRESNNYGCEMKRIALLVTLAACATLDAAQPRQDPQQINRTAETFLERETHGLPGQVEIEIEIGKIDDRVSLPACTKMHAFFPAGSRAWGQTSIGVRCAAPSAWSIYLPAYVKVSADYLIAAKPLVLGQEIASGDLALQHGELTQLPSGVLTDPSQAIGRRLANSVQAGQPLRRDAVREPPAVVQGQHVSLVLIGDGFTISSEGQSLGKAPEGERVQVKTPGGGVVSGIVRSGSVVQIMR